jgi:hypothetical protein
VTAGDGHIEFGVLGGSRSGYSTFGGGMTGGAQVSNADSIDNMTGSSEVVGIGGGRGVGRGLIAGVESTGGCSPDGTQWVRSYSTNVGLGIGLPGVQASNSEFGGGTTGGHRILAVDGPDWSESALKFGVIAGGGLPGLFMSFTDD